MKYTWNEDTLDHFKFIANYDTKVELAIRNHGIRRK